MLSDSVESAADGAIGKDRPMRLSLSSDELLSTTRAVRRRLDLTRPVEREVLLECLALATQAPSGSNSQQWQWLFVTDPDKKRALAEIYNRVFTRAYPPERASAMDPGTKRVWSSAQHLAEHFHDVPVMLIPCHRGRPNEGNQAGYWGSLLPATWSFCLAGTMRPAAPHGHRCIWCTSGRRPRWWASPTTSAHRADCSRWRTRWAPTSSPGPRNDLADIVHWDSW